MTQAQHAHSLAQCHTIAQTCTPIVARGKLYRIALLAQAAASDHFHKGDRDSARECQALAIEVDTLRQSLSVA